MSFSPNNSARFPFEQDHRPRAQNTEDQSSIPLSTVPCTSTGQAQNLPTNGAVVTALLDQPRAPSLQDTLSAEEMETKNEPG